MSMALKPMAVELIIHDLTFDLSDQLITNDNVHALISNIGF